MIKATMSKKTNIKIDIKNESRHLIYSLDEYLKTSKYTVKDLFIKDNFNHDLFWYYLQYKFQDLRYMRTSNTNFIKDTLNLFPANELTSKKYIIYTDNYDVD